MLNSEEVRPNITTQSFSSHFRGSPFSEFIDNEFLKQTKREPTFVP